MNTTTTKKDIIPLESRLDQNEKLSSNMQIALTSIQREEAQGTSYDWQRGYGREDRITKDNVLICGDYVQDFSETEEGEKVLEQADINLRLIDLDTKESYWMFTTTPNGFNGVRQRHVVEAYLSPVSSKNPLNRIDRTDLNTMLRSSYVHDHLFPAQKVDNEVKCYQAEFVIDGEKVSTAYALDMLQRADRVHKPKDHKFYNQYQL